MSDLAFERQPLPEGSVGRRASGWWAMWLVIATEAALFGYLLFAYFYWAVQPDDVPFPQGGPPSLKLALPDTFVLLASSAAVWWGERGVKAGSQSRLVGGLALGLVLGVIFVAVQGFEWKSKTFGIASSAYGSLYFTVTGFHMAHVVAGLLVLAALAVWSALGYFDRSRHAAVSIGALYWHFVDAVWLVIFTAIYLTPYLGGRP